MKKAAQKSFLIAVFLGVMAFLIPSYSAALQPIKLGDESEVTFYGFARNNLGMFLQDPQGAGWGQSGNDLATARTWFRGYTDLIMSDKLRFRSAVQFVHEPWYEVEKGSVSENYHKGEVYSEYNDIDDVLREAFIEWSPSAEHTIKIGRQIAIWGEALTTRVGDVIHPEDSRFTFAFANLEDTRIPSWMVRGIHEFSHLNLTFEWIYNPNVVGGDYTVNRSPAVAALGQPGQRFGIYPETRFKPPFSVTNPALGPPFSIPGAVIFHPLSTAWINLFPDLLPGFWVPTDIPLVTEKFRKGWGKNARGGFRVTKILRGYQLGISFFHTQNYTPTLSRGKLTGAFDPVTSLPIREYPLIHPDIDIIGFYLNKDLPLGVLRTEAIYVPNQVFGTFDMGDSDKVVRRDYVKYMVAYDLNSYFYFTWHNTAPFDITVEHVGELIPDSDDLRYAIYSTHLRTWNPSFNMRIATNWRYNQIATDVVFSYIPWGRSGLFMPTVAYTPPWMNAAWSFELKYINIFARNNYEGLGLLRSKDLIVFTTQFNW